MGHGVIMIKRHFLSLAAVFLMTSSIAALDNPVLHACDLMDEQTLRWDALGKDVTLRTELKGETGSVPFADFYMTIEGREIHLGQGGKFIDDFDPANTPSCEDHLEAAIKPILKSISHEGVFFNSRNFRTMHELDSALHQAEFCNTPPIPYYESEDVKAYLTEFRKTDNWEAAFLSCGPILDIIALESSQLQTTAKQYQKLLAQDAPLIAVPYSTYGVDVLAIDVENYTTHNLFASGC